MKTTTCGSAAREMSDLEGSINPDDILNPDTDIARDSSIELPGTVNELVTSFHRTDIARDCPSSASWDDAAKTVARPVVPVAPLEVPDNFESSESPFPAVGSTVQGFRLLSELGRGAFGRVYLAEQGDLAARRVALKIAREMVAESQTLAQLQHTNIVPIYSYHRIGSLQAVCMPYFGRTTLADVLRGVSGGAKLPISGRELRSTVNRKADETLPNSTASKLDLESPGEPEHREVPPSAGTDFWGRIEELTYVEAILLLGSQLADGLAHAHRRGVLHRDLKPANVLLTDEGRPMLLDFNLSDDTKARAGGAEKAKFGGTLPYMAPEHIAAFASDGGSPVDERSDIFSLGVMLYELLAGRHPYGLHKGSIRDVLAAMIEERRRPVRPLDEWNPSVSPASRAIIHKCLAVDPSARYQSADQIRDDIERQLGHRPLRYAGNPSLSERARKWVRRHPQIASTTTVGIVGAGLLAGASAFAYRAWDESRGSRAAVRLAEHRTAFADVQLFLDDRNQSRPRLDEAEAKLGGLLGRYGVPTDGSADDWLAAEPLRRVSEADQNRVRADMGETFFLLAETALIRALGTPDAGARESHIRTAITWNDAAARYAGERLPRAVREQHAAIAELRGESVAARQLRNDAEATGPNSPRDRYLTGAGLARLGRNREAIGHLTAATRDDPKNFSAWFVRGTVHSALGQDDLAAMAFGACLAIRDDFAPAWMNRGIAFGRLRIQNLAIDDYNRAIDLDSKLIEAYLLRALAKDAVGDLTAAEGDYSLAIASGKAPVRTYFLRAGIRDRRGDQPGANADRATGLKLEPTDEASWIGRAEMRAEADPAGALDDVERALTMNPFSLDALQMKAHLLAERLQRPAEAMDALNRAVQFYPDSAPARAGRGVVLARQGKRAAALQDARDALLADLRAPNLYQVACIYALTSKENPADRDEAFRLLWAALKGGFGRDLYKTDADLDPIRREVAFARVVERVAEVERAER